VRGLGLAGAIAIGFGLGSYYVTGELGRFAQANLVAGGAALLLAALLSLRRMHGLGSPATRGALARRALGIVAVAALALALERGAARPGLGFDWTLERRFTLAPATLTALRALPDDLVATLYYDADDPRLRGSQLLLSAFAATGEIEARERDLEHADADLDRFGALPSNSVVLESQGRHEIVTRPTEGTLWEGLQRLAARDREGVLYFARGEGEADPTRGDPAGWSGAAAALANEGYAVREIVLAAASAIPDDAAALILAAPHRVLRPETVALLQGWLARGGGLVLLLEPGVETGLEPLLEAWGFALPDGLVVDPASGPLEGGAPGVNPLVHAYADHPVTRDLDANRMTFFVQARAVNAVRKPEPEDELGGIAFTSPRAWLTRDLAGVARGAAPADADGAEPQRFSLAALGRYPRDGGEARIAVFGDADFASNRHLRSLYNLDLFMNTVHWVAGREPEITRRAKLLTPVQRPLTVQESLSTFYGLGLLLPELLLIGAALAWARRRSA
jgi:hypothetical protein